MQENVRRLDVTVHHPLLVRGGKPAGHLPQDLENLTRLHQAALQHLVEALTPDVLHGDEVLLFLNAVVVDPDDVGMVNLARQHRLPMMEILEEGFPAADVLPDELDGDLISALEVSGAVDRPHAALAELFFQLKSPDLPREDLRKRADVISPPHGRAALTGKRPAQRLGGERSVCPVLFSGD